MKKILLPILLFSNVLSAQTGLWLDAGITKKWNKSFKTSFEIGERQNIGLGFDRLYIEVGPTYQVLDGVKITGAYRLVSNEKGDQFVLQADRLSQRFQIGTDISILDAFDLGPKRLDISWSSTQQWSMQVGKQSSSIWRNKLSMSYDIKNFPLSPCFSAEHFYRWNANIVYTPTDVLISGATVQWRYFLGADLELPKKHSLKLQIGLRSTAAGAQPLVRASYQYSLK
ncbi:MAG: hypothetical protein RL331_1480 [Bacteroidota bacterium]|jgi:hypothetical protein